MQKLKINLRIYVGIEMALGQNMIYYHLRKVGKKILDGKGFVRAVLGIYQKRSIP